MTKTDTVDTTGIIPTYMVLDVVTDPVVPFLGFGMLASDETDSYVESLFSSQKTPEANQQITWNVKWVEYTAPTPKAADLSSTLQIGGAERTNLSWYPSEKSTTNGGWNLSV
jgi:hypothetical protein